MCVFVTEMCACFVQHDVATVNEVLLVSRSVASGMDLSASDGICSSR